MVQKFSGCAGHTGLFGTGGGGLKLSLYPANQNPKMGHISVKKKKKASIEDGGKANKRISTDAS